MQAWIIDLIPTFNKIILLAKNVSEIAGLVANSIYPDQMPHFAIVCLDLSVLIVTVTGLIDSSVKSLDHLTDNRN